MQVFKFLFSILTVFSIIKMRRQNPIPFIDAEIQNGIFPKNKSIFFSKTTKSEYIFGHDYNCKIIEEENISKHYAEPFKKVFKDKPFFSTAGL